MNVGDLVKRKSGNTDYNIHGIITKVYESRIKKTVEVMWLDCGQLGSSYTTIEPCFLEKVS